MGDAETLRFKSLKSLLKKQFTGKVSRKKGEFVLRNQQLVFIFGTVKKILLYTGLLLFILPQAAKAQFETSRDSVVQLYGVVMTADSLVGVPAVSIKVKIGVPSLIRRVFSPL